MNNTIHCNIHLLLKYFDGIFLLESWYHNLIAKLLWFVTKIFLEFHIVSNKLKRLFRCHSTIARIANIKKWQQMSNPLLVGVQTSSQNGNQCGGFSKRKNNSLTIWSSYSTIECIPKGIHILLQRLFVQPIFVGLFPITRKLKQPIYLSTNE